jgi:hypothetical protein
MALLAHTTVLARRLARALLVLYLKVLGDLRERVNDPLICLILRSGTNLLSNQPIAIKFVSGSFGHLSLFTEALLDRNLANPTPLNYEMSIVHIAPSTTPVRNSPSVNSVPYVEVLFLLFTAGIPHVHYFGQEGLHNVLVIDLLGPNLEDLFDMCGRKFSIKTVCMAAKQMVSVCLQGYVECVLGAAQAWRPMQSRIKCVSATFG